MLHMQGVYIPAKNTVLEESSLVFISEIDIILSLKVACVLTTLRNGQGNEWSGSVFLP